MALNLGSMTTGGNLGVGETFIIAFYPGAGTDAMSRS
jgi:hypothetical protein